jgi:hypothetical protein
LKNSDLKGDLNKAPVFSGIIGKYKNNIALNARYF